jgi:rare lipoprotein A
MAKQPIDQLELAGTAIHDRHQLRVLLVEDNPIQQMAIAHLLKHLGHAVSVAGDGFEALSAVQRESCYDIILMDCHMPLMDGFEAARLIREAERITGQQTAIIGISADDSPDKCFMAGMDDFVSKPLHKVLLKAVLEQWTREKRNRKMASMRKGNSIVTVMLFGAMLSIASVLPLSAKSTTVGGNTKPNTAGAISAKIGSLTHKAMPSKLLSGIASWYGMPFHGRRTASGQIYDMNKLTAAHQTLPLSSQVMVENPGNGKVVVITVTDRGPYIKNRVIDLSREAAKQLGILSRGIAYVNYSVIPSPAQVVSRSSSGIDHPSISALP